MAENRCPGCGAPYNGRKCRICLYTSMETNLSRNAKPVSPAPRPKQKRSAVGSMVGFLLILVLIAIVLPFARNFGRKLEAIDAANRTPEPIPGNSAVLFQQEDITVLVPKQDTSGISLWFYNHGKEDIMVVCKDIAINGCRIENAEVSVYIPAGSAVKSTLPEPETFADEVTFAMEAQKSSGEFLFETAPISLKERTMLYG